MQRQDILPVLYDLSVTIGRELRLKPLLTRTLQRLLYHTSYSAGLICLDVPACGSDDTMVEVHLSAAVGDFELVSRVGQTVSLPCAWLREPPPSTGSTGAVAPTQGPPAPARPGLAARYGSHLCLRMDAAGVIVLLAPIAPDTGYDLHLVFRPMLAQLARAVILCRALEAHEAETLAHQQRLQSSLDQTEQLFQSLVDLSPIGVGFSTDGIAQHVNQVFLDMFGYASLADLQGRPVTDLIAPTHRDAVAENVRRRMLGEPVATTYETVGLRRDGSTFPVLISARRLVTAMGARTLSFFVDLSEIKRTEQALRSANVMLNMVLETAPLRIFWKDKNLRYLGCNTAFAHDAGRQSADELLGQDDTQMGWHAQAALYQADDRLVIASGQPRLNIEEPQTTPDGRQIWLRTSKVPLRDGNGEIIGVLGIYDDITDQKLVEARVHELAFYDPLTKLPNRRLLQDRLFQAMVSSARSGCHGALLMLDLDNFKNINDTKGHDLGDRLLVDVAARLTTCLKDTDTVARFAGDEFVVVVANLSVDAREAAEAAERLAERLRDALSAPYHFGQLTVTVTASLGLALFLGQQDTVHALLQHGETAMYQAKQSGRNAVRFFDASMQAAFESRLQMIEDLARAVEQDQLRLYYQPQVSGNGELTGAEVLMRWIHPRRGLVSPAQFIPLAEASGQIVPMGLWAIRTTCAQLKRWQGQAAMRNLTLSVNVSAKQFRKADFVDQVRRTLLETGAKPSHLKLELTESTVLENVEDTIAKMRELKLLGISFSMDDFGTGYSSLQYLKRLPLDQIKIDQSFVRDITTDPNDAAIVQTVIAMSDALGLNVIAEGVETVEQKDFLDQRGCHAFQGYLFGKPMPLDDFERLPTG